MPQLFEVAPNHGQRKEHCDGVTSRRIWRQLSFGNLLHSDKTESALDQLLPTAREHQPLLFCLRVSDLSRCNEGRISLTAQGKRHFEAHGLWNGCRDDIGILRDRIEQLERSRFTSVLCVPRCQ